MKLSDFGLCKPVDVTKVPTLRENEAAGAGRWGLQPKVPGTCCILCVVPPNRLLRGKPSHGGTSKWGYFTLLGQAGGRAYSGVLCADFVCVMVPWPPSQYATHFSVSFQSHLTVSPSMNLQCAVSASCGFLYATGLQPAQVSPVVRLHSRIAHLPACNVHHALSLDLHLPCSQQQAGSPSHASEADRLHQWQTNRRTLVSGCGISSSEPLLAGCC